MNNKKDIFTNYYYRDCMDKADSDFEKLVAEAGSNCEMALTRAKETYAQASARADTEYQVDLEKVSAANRAGVDYCNEQFGPAGSQQVSHCLDRIREAYDRDLAEAQSAKADKQADAENTYVAACDDAESRRAQGKSSAERQLECDQEHCKLYLSEDARKPGQTPSP